MKYLEVKNIKVKGSSGSGSGSKSGGFEYKNSCKM